MKDRRTTSENVEQHTLAYEKEATEAEIPLAKKYQITRSVTDNANSNSSFLKLKVTVRSPKAGHKHCYSITKGSHNGPVSQTSTFKPYKGCTPRRGSAPVPVPKPPESRSEQATTESFIAGSGVKHVALNPSTHQHAREFVDSDFTKRSDEPITPDSQSQSQTSAHPFATPFDREEEPQVSTRFTVPRMSVVPNRSQSQYEPPEISKAGILLKTRMACNRPENRVERQEDDINTYRPPESLRAGMILRERMEHYRKAKC